MNILVIGGGVAGVASGIALRQRGFSVRVLERHRERTTIGAGIVVWPNAAFVLDRLGVLAEVEGVAGRPHAMRRRASTGEDLGTLDIRLIDRQMGYPSLSVLRSDFQDILLARLSALGVDVEYEMAVDRLGDTANGGAVAILADGRAIAADAIIGADGRMASRARQYVHGHNAPLYQGFVNWIGVASSEVAMFDDIAVTDDWGVGERFGIVPITAYKAYWAGGAASAAIDTKNPAAYKAELTALFSDWPEPVRRVIAATPTQRIHKIYVHDHDPLRCWHRDNVIAIGDAAHASLPTSGQGACQALEDAWHLASCLAAQPDDLTRAYDTFTRLRLDKTTGVTMAGRALAASLFNRDEQACVRRNEASKSSDFAALAAGMARGWSRHLPVDRPHIPDSRDGTARAAATEPPLEDGEA